MILDHLLNKVRALIIDHGVFNPTNSYWLSQISNGFVEFLEVFDINHPDEDPADIDRAVDLALVLASALVGFALFLTQGHPDDRDLE